MESFDLISIIGANVGTILVAAWKLSDRLTKVETIVSILLEKKTPSET